MTTIRKRIIFTDLDGTLLDPKTYSFESARPALRLISQRDIPLVLSSSKTRAEIEMVRKELQNGHPFISENGSAIFIPKGYFSFQYPHDRETDSFFILEMGTSYLRIIKVLESIKRETGIPIKGFSDLTEQEISSHCGLSLKEAALAKIREYDEPFLIDGGDKEIALIQRAIEEKGMRYVWGGRFHHILGKSDKGKAVAILKEFYENQFFSIETIGIGDSPNDLPMLLRVDRPILLGGGQGVEFDSLSAIQNLTVVDGSGSESWNTAVLRILMSNEKSDRSFRFI